MPSIAPERARLGFTKEQHDYLNSPPWARSVYQNRDGHPYIPAVLVAVILQEAFGLDGFSIEEKSATINVAAFDKGGDGGRSWAVTAVSRVRVYVHLRDEDGYVTPERIFRDGVNSHTMFAKSESTIGQAQDSAVSAAYSQAIRSAVRTLGLVFGDLAMRLHEGPDKTKFNWRDFVSPLRPVAPSLPGVQVSIPDAAFDVVLDEEGQPLTVDQPRQRQIQQAQPQAPQQAQQPPPQAPQQQAPQQQAPQQQAPQQQAPQQVQETPARSITPAALSMLQGNTPIPDVPDGKPYVVDFLNPDGSPARRFSGDPKATADGLQAKGATSIRVDARTPQDVEIGELRFPSVSQGRTFLVESIRGCFRPLTIEVYGPIVRAHGTEPATFARAPDKGGLDDAGLQKLLTALNAEVRQRNQGQGG